MLNFFKAETPLLLQSRKFALAMLFFACLASASINVSTASNAEIAGFIVSESNKILQVPNSAALTLDFQTAKDNHGRAGYLFFWGKREVSINVEYVLTLENSEQLKGSVKVDTSWFTGYCGMIECRSMPMPAQQRIETVKALVQKALAELNEKFYGVFAAIKPAAANQEPPATEAPPVADTLPQAETPQAEEPQAPAEPAAQEQ